MTTMPKQKPPRPPAPEIAPEIMKSFERAFGENGAGCVRQCACGMTFYNSDGGWTWEPGELEELDKWRKAGKARDLEWAVSYITVDGTLYVVDCECWHDRGRRVVAWILGHRYAIAEFLKLEAARRKEAAAQFPTVE